MKKFKEFINEAKRQPKLKNFSDVFNWVMDMPFNTTIEFPKTVDYNDRVEWSKQLVDSGIAQMTDDPKTGKRILTKLD